MWRATVLILTMLAVGLIAFGSWYSNVSEWHPCDHDAEYECRVDISLWPPSVGWGESLAD